MPSNRFRSALRPLASLKLTTLLLLLILVEVLVGTLIQTREGLWASQRWIFHNWLGGMPFLCGLAVINLVAAFLVRFRWAWRNTGLLVSHLGLLALLLSGAAGLYASRSSSVDLGTLEPASAGQVPGEWELVVRTSHQADAPHWGHPLENLHPGVKVELYPGGPVAKVLEKAANGTLSKDGSPKVKPREKEPDANIPVIALELEGNAKPERLALADVQPFAPLGKDALIFLQRRQHRLPFTLQLLSFRRETHPGSTRPKAFESRVKVIEGSSAREAVISMNHPLRIGHFTVYQASWRTDEQNGTERTILAVVENPLDQLPYYATLLIALGLSIHFLPRLRRRPALAALFLMAATSTQAAQTTQPLAPVLPQPPASLLSLPIQIDGRVKSFETFAEHTLLELSGRSTLSGLSAPQWLTAVLLSPEQVADLPAILIEHPDTRDALGLSGKERDRYPWRSIKPLGLKIDALARAASGRAAEERSALDRDLLRLSDAWARYASLENALAFLRPGSVAYLADSLRPARTFLEMAQNSVRHAVLLDSLASLPPERRTASDTLRIAWYRQTFEKAAMWRTSVFPVLPRPDSTELPWQSPGTEMLERGLTDPGFARTAADWDSLSRAWSRSDAPAMERSARSLTDSVISRAGTSLRPLALQAEGLYNRIRPFRWAAALFWLALVPGLWGAWKERDLLLRLSAGLSLAGLAAVVAGMGLRMAITLRPPVTNLYETFLFVCAVAVPSLLLAGHLRRWVPGAPLAALGGAMLLMLAGSFGADGDTMPVLVAVLDSNFWLTVHVLTITVGYAGVVASGLAAHWHLVQLRRGRNDGAEVVRGLMAFGLFFTFVGTLLGGVWADQSWGRFWGWDPKENGALIIVLWAAALFHARKAGQIANRGFSVGAVLSISTVLFAWFGVNLLGVGLHSYGFTEGTFLGLAAYAVLQGLFLAWVLRRPKAALPPS